MDLLDDKQIQQAIHATVAKTILDGLDTEHRDALLQKSIVATIDGYDFRNAVSKVAAEKAAAVAEKRMQSEEWTRRIEEAIRGGFDDYLTNLRAAIPGALAAMLHGKPGSYASAADILRCWPEKTKG